MTAQPLTEAAKKAAKSNQWVAYLTGGLLVALGVFMLVMDVINPSKPGHSATPVALGFIGAGVLFTLVMRPLLRKRARDAAAMGEQIAERAGYVNAELARLGSVSFYRASKLGSLVATLLLSAFLAWLFFMIDGALQENRGIDIGWTARGLAIVLLPPFVWLCYRFTRGWRHELTDSILRVQRGSSAQELRFNEVTRATMSVVGIRVRGTHAGFQVTLQMFAESGSMTLADTLGPRPVGGEAPRELTRGDVLCWVWVHKGEGMGLREPPA
jgi:hypothetical protein